MRAAKSPPFLMLYAILAMGMSFFFQGCASTETNAYRVIGSTAVSVDGLRKGWNDYVRAGHATSSQVKQVADAYDKYALAMATAQSAVTSYKTGATDRTSLQSALDAVSAASGDVVRLIASFNGGKP